MGHRILTSKALRQAFERTDQGSIKFPFLVPSGALTRGRVASHTARPLSPEATAWWGTRTGKGGEERRSERQVGGGGGGEGPRGRGEAGRGRCSWVAAANQACGPASRNPGSGFITCSPSTSLQATGRAPWKSGTPPPHLLRAQAVLTPAASDPPLPSRGPGSASYPGGLGRWCPKWGASVGDLEAGSAHSGP